MAGRPIPPLLLAGMVIPAICAQQAAPRRMRFQRVWEPTLMVVFQSIRLNPRRVEREVLRQAQATRTLTGVQDVIAQIDADIAASRVATKAAIARQGQLNPLGHHTRRDPRTGPEHIVPNDATGVTVDPNTAAQGNEMRVIEVTQ